jgi:hypothetical protein
MTVKNYPGIETSDPLSDPVGYVSSKVNDKIWGITQKGAESIGRGIDKFLKDLLSGPEIVVAPSPRRGRTGYGTASRSYDSGEQDSDIEFVGKLERYLSGDEPVRHVRTDRHGLRKAYKTPGGETHKGPLFAVSRRDGDGQTIYTNRKHPKFLADYLYAHEVSELVSPGALDDGNLERHFGVETRTLDALRYIWQTSQNRDVSRRARNAYISGIAVSRIGRASDSLSRAVSSLYRVPEVIDKLVQSAIPEVEVVLQEG